MHQIVIIGTDPPCPRCGLLFNAAAGKVQELNIPAEVVHWTYTDAEAGEFAGSMGLEAGTAKDVAKRINREIDKTELDKLLKEAQPDPGNPYSEYNDCGWSPELDEFLRLFEARAGEAGILMTPVLLINGELKHQGSVPELQQLEEWLLALKDSK